MDRLPTGKVEAVNSGIGPEGISVNFGITNGICRLGLFVSPLTKPVVSPLKKHPGKGRHVLFSAKSHVQMMFRISPIGDF